MTDKSYRALVVDDEPAVRSLAIRALQREGFSCDAAADGQEAERMIPRGGYDAVVTDLRMPNKNGHALATDILLMRNRPVVVIVTGVLEPRLAKDMTIRGVDCIEFKPVNYMLFAAKVRGLVEGRKLHGAAEQPGPLPPLPALEKPPSVADSPKIDRTVVTKQDIEGKLTQLTRILPISGVAFDIFNMTNTETYDSTQIALAVRRDATLSVDILRLANSAYYNYSTRRIANLVKAISRIGQRRVGELALATSMMVALTPTVLPWMDIGLTWHRSMAAAAAIDRLAEKRGVPRKENRLFLSSITYPLGRIALCMLYPKRYQEMVSLCERNHLALRDQERQFFSLSPEEVVGFLLKAWNIPYVLVEPLVYSAQSYNAVASLGGPLATKVELLKMAILVAEIAVGRWESWDRIDIPPEPLLGRLAIDRYDEVIEKVKADADELIRVRAESHQLPAESQAARNGEKPQAIRYCNLSAPIFDFFEAIVSRSGFELTRIDSDSLPAGEPLIVNCIGAPPHRLVTRLKSTISNPNMLIVTDSAQTESLCRFGRVLTLPASYGALKMACREILK